MQALYKIGNREFALDRKKAEAAFAAKRVVNGKRSMTFNLLPLKYQWAYDLYQRIKADQWGPMRADIQMEGDVIWWRSDLPNESERRIVRLAVGWLAAGREAANQTQAAVRELLTAPELKLVLGRQVQEDNLRTEMLLFVIHKLELNPHDCERLLMRSPAVAALNGLLAAACAGVHREYEFGQADSLRRLAKAIFALGPCGKGVAGSGLFAVLLTMHRAGPLSGFGRMVGHMLRIEAHHVEFYGHLLQELLGENESLDTTALHAEFTTLMREAVALEKQLVRELVADEVGGVGVEALQTYVEHVADSRLRCCRLEPLHGGVANPLPWMDALTHLRSFSLTKLKPTGLLQTSSDDDL